MSPRILLASVCLLALPVAVFAQSEAGAPPTIQGSIDNGYYVSPTGLFKIPIPVIPALGGTISDSASVVTFRDAFTTSITIAVFPLDQAQVAELQTIGPKDYLVQFFTDVVLKNLITNFRGASAEPNARYIAKAEGGAVLVYTLLPGGSAFNPRIELFPGNDNIPIAKRGNLAFIHDNHVILISSELGERSTERSAYTLTSDQQDQILRTRLLALADSMELLTPPAAPAAAK